MRPLSDQDILRVWETGQSQHPLDRALTLLLSGLRDCPFDTIARLSIGQRDAYLLTLRELTFGTQMEGIADCPRCRERLEFNVSVAELRVSNPAIPLEAYEAIETASEYTLNLEGFELQFSLPSSRDLAAVVNCSDLSQAHQRLTQRCIHQIRQNGVSVEYSTLPTRILTQFAEQIADYDPQAEIWLNLRCPACDHAWQVLFDIVTFFWAELNAYANRLLQDVHRLARFYGWREADILSMSSRRRQFYLEQVGA
jgi:hypothetical protein